MKVKFNFRGQVNEGVVIDTYNSDYDGREMLVIKCDERGTVIENVPTECCEEIKGGTQMTDQTKLAYLAWKLEMKLDTHKEVAQKEDPDTFLTTYRKGAMVVINDTHELAKEILALANKMKHEQYKGYLIEDVDLTGSEQIGQRIDKYA